MNNLRIAKELLAAAKILAWGPYSPDPVEIEQKPVHRSPVNISNPMRRPFGLNTENVQIMDAQGTDLEIITYESNGKLFGMAFAGKSNKPIWRYRFRDEAQRQRQIDSTIENRKAIIEVKKKRFDERRNFRHSLKIDDILYDSWGYDQTQNDFFQVVAVGEKSVKIREIGKKSAGRDTVVALKDHFVGPPQTKVVQTGNSIAVESGHATLWDGKPKYETPYGMGH